METIVINAKSYTLAADGYRLGSDGGRVIFQPGEASFEEVEADLIAGGAIKVLDDSGAPLSSRSDLVYAGRLTRDTNYIIGTEQVQTETDDEGSAVYETQDKIGTVMIAEFRQPDARERCDALEAQLQYVAMMTGTDMEV